MSPLVDRSATSASHGRFMNVLAQKLFAAKILFLGDFVNGLLVVGGSTHWVRRGTGDS